MLLTLKMVINNVIYGDTKLLIQVIGNQLSEGVDKSD